MKPIKNFSLPRLDFVANFLNSRNPREKKMILIFGFTFIFVLDYMFWLSPVFRVFGEITPRIQPLQQELSTLKEDQQNKDAIQKKWLAAKKDIEEKNRQFIGPNETPALLENLSRQAQKSGAKITSLEPFEGGKSSESKGGYSPLPIQVKASAGTHEFGAFLSYLESGPTFFKVKDLKISNNPLNERKHNIELSMEAYKREKQ